MPRPSLVFVLLAAASACSDDSTPGVLDAPLAFDASPFDARPGIDARPAVDASTGPIVDAGPPPDAAPFPNVNLGLLPIASGLSSPVAIVVPPGETRSFVADQHLGQVRIIESGSPRATAFLDVTQYVTLSTGTEEGLLGLAFHPDYQTNGRFFVYFTGVAKGGSDSAMNDKVWEFHRGSDANSTNGTHQEILSVAHDKAPNHNGGNIIFGPDGMLYIGIGDGGGQYDDTGMSSRVLSLRLSKILRIDVNHDAPYQAPTDNPFYGTAGAADTFPAQNDIWMWGLRNPWRWSFDRMNGDLWIGDVGQDCWEEIDVARAGQKGIDFGWETVEGNGHCPVKGGTCGQTGNCTQTGAMLPVLDYDHSKGVAVVGGYVYRGTAIPEIQGMYFFSDDATGFMRSFWAATPVPFDQTKLWNSLHGGNVSTFGEDQNGEIRFCSLDGTCHQIVKQ